MAHMPPTPGPVEVAPFGVIAGEVSAAQALRNTTAINAAIEAHDGTGKTLELPSGEVWIDMSDDDAANWSIYFNGRSDLHLRGNGTTLVQTGVGSGGDWAGILINNSSNIKISNLTIRQGTIEKPSTGQHDHLIQVRTTGADGVCDGIVIEDCVIGKSIGDGISFVGDESPITNTRVSRCTFEGNGAVLRAWEASTDYTVGDVVTNGGRGYKCTVAGRSASATGPTGSDEEADEIDGTVTWDYDDNYYRFAARACITFQRGYRNILVEDCYLYGAQNSPLDMESTGSGVMSYARFHRVFVDNSFGNSSVAWSFSGAHDTGDDSEYSEIVDCTVYQGRITVYETSNARVIGTRFIETEAPAADTTSALLEVRYGNGDLVFENCHWYRLGTSAAGHLCDLAHGGPFAATSTTSVTFNACKFVQTTNGGHIVWDGISDMSIEGCEFIDTNATAGRSIISGSAVSDDCDRPTIRNITIRATGGTMKTAVDLATRTTKSMSQIHIANIQQIGCTVGVYLSATVGSGMDMTPVLINVGKWTQVDNSDSTITTIFPIISGNPGDVCTHVGSDTPEGAVTAVQGCLCIRKNGDSSALYFKQTGTSNTGWTAVTVP